jgi:hypothetical protein
VDSLVHEILVANSAGAHCSFVTEEARLGQGEKSAVFPKKNNLRAKWMNLFKHLSDSVDIIRDQAWNRHENGSNWFDINPFSPICDSDRRLLDPSEASARDTFPVADPWCLYLSCAIAPRIESPLPIVICRGDQHLVLPGSAASCIFPPCSSSPKPMPPRSALSLIKMASCRPRSRCVADSRASLTMRRRGPMPGPSPDGGRCLCRRPR